MVEIIQQEVVERKIYLIRGQKVMIDRDLAELYGVETRTLNQAVSRNIKRFPPDFMFQLNAREVGELSRSQIVILKRGNNIKYSPYVFTENGVAMLSGILKSDRGISVNIQIMGTFTKLRELMPTRKDLKRKYDEQFHVVFDAIKQLLESPKRPKRKIGFNRE